MEESKVASKLILTIVSPIFLFHYKLLIMTHFLSIDMQLSLRFSADVAAPSVKQRPLNAPFAIIIEVGQVTLS